MKFSPNIQNTSEYFIINNIIEAQYELFSLFVSNYLMYIYLVWSYEEIYVLSVSGGHQALVS